MFILLRSLSLLSPIFLYLLPFCLQTLFNYNLSLPFCFPVLFVFPFSSTTHRFPPCLNNNTLSLVVLIVTTFLKFLLSLSDYSKTLASFVHSSFSIFNQVYATQMLLPIMFMYSKQTFHYCL
jgi:hypothetical protein